MYIYEQPGWPQFTWNSEIVSSLLIPLRHEQGRLIGEMQSTGFPFKEAAILEALTEDAVKTSAIEGEVLDPALVRSSIARHLGIEVAVADKLDRNVEGIVAMLLDATQNFREPLTQERLFHWHSTLFPTGRSGYSKIHVGGWRRGSVEVVSGAMGREKVHFEGPAADKVHAEMKMFLNWFNETSQMDFVLKAAIAHLWFVTIHPFEDGNGRIGRAIADLCLARSEKSCSRFYSLSAQIQAERKGYYHLLEQTQKGGLDITPWLEWFFHCLSRAIGKATSVFQSIQYKERVWNALQTVPLNERQRKLIGRLLEGFEGKLTTSKWAKIAKCSQDTAHRDILDLVERGLLIKNPEKGRSTSYTFVPLSF